MKALKTKAGQGLVEYALLLVLVAVTVIVVLVFMGPEIGDVLSQTASGLEEGSLAYPAPPTPTATPVPSPTP